MSKPFKTMMVFTVDSTSASFSYGEWLVCCGVDKTSSWDFCLSPSLSGVTIEAINVPY